MKILLDELMLRARIARVRVVYCSSSYPAAHTTNYEPCMLAVVLGSSFRRRNHGMDYNEYSRHRSYCFILTTTFSSLPLKADMELVSILKMKIIHSNIDLPSAFDALLTVMCFEF